MKGFLIVFLLLISVRSWAQHFVLVAGINNEQVSNYFTSFEAYLKARNFGLITRVKPSSLRTVSENADSLRERLIELYQSHAEPLIIVSHSKGGLEVANMLARYHRDFSAVVIRAIFVNTPFQGSPYMAESIREFEAQWGQFGNQCNPVYLNALRVMKSLGTETVKADLAQSFSRLTPSQKHDLSQKFFYLRTQKDADKVSMILKKSAQFLKDSGPNDGLIPTSNQLMPNFGHDLGILKDTDHTDLFIRKWALESAEASGLDSLLKPSLSFF